MNQPVTWFMSTCKVCGPLPDSEFYLRRGKPRSLCKGCWKHRNNLNYRENRKDRIASAIQRKRDNPEAARRDNRNARQRLKVKVLTAYAGPDPVCSCCGEQRLIFLTLDHVGGGGNEHRKSISGTTSGGSRFYTWIVKNNYPMGFRVLCHNCNFAEANGGCPHRMGGVGG